MQITKKIGVVLGELRRSFYFMGISQDIRHVAKRYAEILRPSELSEKAINRNKSAVGSADL